MLLIYATNFANILIARILMGCGVGTLFPITYMYSSEIALVIEVPILYLKLPIVYTCNFIFRFVSVAPQPS